MVATWTVPAEIPAVCPLPAIVMVFPGAIVALLAVMTEKAHFNQFCNLNLVKITSCSIPVSGVATFWPGLVVS